MATKKKTADAPVDVPGFLGSDERSRLVARAKASLAKKWSLTRAESLADAVQLAWFLVALARDEEARELVDHIADRTSFRGDHDLWWTASYAISLSARLARLRDDEARRASLIARLVEHPAFVRSVGEAEKDVRSAEVDPSQKWALQGFARGCARAAYFRETAAAAAHEPGVVVVDALERTIAEGLDGLRAHLAR